MLTAIICAIVVLAIVGAYRRILSDVCFGCGHEFEDGEIVHVHKLKALCSRCFRRVADVD